MLKARKNPLLSPGTWNLWKTGKHLLLFACPMCGDVFVLLYRVNDDGIVTQPIRCTKPKCGWENHVLLQGWEPFPSDEYPGVV